MGRIIGIDLGTTNSVMATVGEGGPRIIQNRENEDKTLSIVSFHKGELLVGTPAFQRWLINPRETVVSIKRLIGRGFNDPEVQRFKAGDKGKEWIKYEIVQPPDGTADSLRVVLGGNHYSPVEISARILEKMKKDAEYVLGEEVSHAVITVPAYFSDKQRNATREAGLKAGLKVMKILDEPTAAAVAYGIEDHQGEPKTILVFDLGGGTLDISVLMMASGAFSPLNLEGDMWLGGDDFDEIIVSHVLAEIKSKYGLEPRSDTRFMAALKKEAQRAKETLSSAAATDVILAGQLRDDSGEPLDIEVEITRTRFDEMIRPLIDKMRKMIEKAVINANFEFNDIDHVLMAGNSTAVPAIQVLMEQLFGKEKILRAVHPKHSVAIGAAVTAALLQAVNCPTCGHNNPLDAGNCEKCATELVINRSRKCPACGRENPESAEKCRDCNTPFFELEGLKGGIAPFHYGVATADDKFHIFISKGDPFETPEEKRIVQTFYTHYPNQRVICVPVYGGDHLEKASLNVKQGEVFSVLPRGFPEKTPVKVKLWLDHDGSFVVDNFLDEAHDLEDLMLRGEEDQKVVELLTAAEEKFHARKDQLAPNVLAELESKRDQVLDKLDRKEFSAAGAAAAQLLQAVENAGAPDLMKKAENIISNINYYVQRYSWLMQADGLSLSSKVEELKSAVSGGNRQLIENKINELDTAFNLCQEKNQLLKVLVSINQAIVSIVHPVDALQAGELLREFEQIEAGLKNNDLSAQSRFAAFMLKLNAALQSCLQKGGGKTSPCRSCGQANPIGARNCKACGADLWGLVSL